jgi:hypothetical protein
VVSNAIFEETSCLTQKSCGVMAAGECYGQARLIRGFTSSTLSQDTHFLAVSLLYMGIIHFSQKLQFYPYIFCV